MSNTKEEKKADVMIREAKSFEINFPKSKHLEEKEQKSIQNSITKGGIAVTKKSEVTAKTYINSKNLPKILNTDKKSVAIIMNKVSELEIKKLGDEEYLSTSQIVKEICDREEQPRPKLEREKLSYSKECVTAFRNNKELDKERTIQADRIAQERSKITPKILNERNPEISELTGKKLDNTKEGAPQVHHINRVADNPERALDKKNLIVLRTDEHKEFHSSNYLQNAEGLEKFKKDKLKK